MEQLALGLAAGAFGGNILGNVLHRVSLGTLVNTIAGCLGGFAITKLSPQGGVAFELAQIAPIVATSIAAGAVLTGLVGVLRNLWQR